jgi:hypothetical protein
MPRTVTVTIAGRDYEVQELRSRANEAWRKRLQEPFGALVRRLEGAGETDITSPRELVGLVQDTAGVLLQSPETLRELLFAYAPALEQDRERILEEAYDSELLDALVQVLKLAFPFGGIVDKVSGLARLGQTPARTMPNSRSRSGAAGTTSSRT